MSQQNKGTSFGNGNKATAQTFASTNFTVANGTWALNAPSGVQAGDLLLAIFFGGVSGQNVAPTASGWTSAVTPANDGAGSSIAVMYRIATGTDAYTFTHGGATPGGWARVTRISGVDTTTPIDAIATNVVSSASATHATASITTTVNNAHVWAAFTASDSSFQTWTPNPGSEQFWNERFDADTSQGPSGSLATAEIKNKRQLTAGAISTSSVRSGTAKTGVNVILAVRPTTTVTAVNFSPQGVDLGTPSKIGAVQVCSIVCDGSATVTPPAGWTLAASQLADDSSARMYFYWRILTSTPATLGTWSLSDDVHWCTVTTVWDGLDPVSPIGAVATGTNSNVTTATYPALTTTVDDSLVLDINGGFNVAYVGNSSGLPSNDLQEAFYTGSTAQDFVGYEFRWDSYTWRQATAGAAPARSAGIATAWPVHPIVMSIELKVWRPASTKAGGTGTTASGTVPSGTATGDLLIAHVAADSNAATITPPSGWTLLGSASAQVNDVGGSNTQSVYYRIVQGGDTSTPAWTLSSSLNWVVGLSRVKSGTFNTTRPCEFIQSAWNGYQPEARPETSSYQGMGQPRPTVNRSLLLAFGARKDPSAGGTITKNANQLQAYQQNASNLIGWMAWEHINGIYNIVDLFVPSLASGRITRDLATATNVARNSFVYVQVNHAYHTDIDPPSLSSDKADGAQVSGSLTTTLTVTDTGTGGNSGVSGINSVIFVVDDTGYATDGSVPLTGTKDTTTLPDGLHFFTYVVEDLNRNRAFLDYTHIVKNDPLAPVVRSRSFVMGSATCAKPSGVVAGDLLLAQVACDDGETPVAPSGWTQVHAPTSTGGNGIKSAMFWKAAGGSEPSSYTWSGTTAVATNIGILRITGADTTAPINAETSSGPITYSSGFAVPRVTTTHNHCLIVGHMAQDTAAIATWLQQPGTVNPYAWNLEEGSQFHKALAFWETQSAAGLAPARTVGSPQVAAAAGGEVAIVPDVTGPTVAITTPANGATISGSAVSVAATATDPSGIEGVQFEVDGAPYGAAQDPFLVGVQGTSGTSEPAVATLPAGIQVGDVIMLYCASQSSGGTYSTPTGFTTLQADKEVDLSHEITAFYKLAVDTDVGRTSVSVAKSVATNWHIVAVVVRGVDQTSPLVGVAEADGTGTAVSSHPVNGSAINFIGVTKAMGVAIFDAFSGSAAWTPPSGWTEDYDVYAGLARLAVDHKIVTSNPGTLTGVTDTNVSSWAALVAYFRVPPGEDPTTPYATTIDTGSLSNGSHTISAVATDAGGNQTTATITVTVLNDAGPPTVSITAPADGDTVSGLVDITATAADDVGVTRVDFAIDGSVLTSDTTSPYSMGWNTFGVTEGSHTITATAYDAAGHSTSATITVNIDRTGPSLSITAPTSGQVVSGSVNLAASASDPSGIASVEFQVDGVSVGLDFSSPYSVAWDSNTVADGSHTLTVAASDTRGNSTTQTVNFIVSNTLPTVSITFPVNGTEATGVVPVSISASSPNGIDHVSIQVDGNPMGTTDATTPYQVTFDSTQLTNGSHHIEAVAYDIYGATRISSSVTVFVNNPNKTKIVGAA